MKLSIRNGIKRAILLVAIPLAFFNIRSAMAETFDDSARGSYDNAGVFATGGSGTSTGNYLTGFYTGDGATQYRSFFTFDLTGLSGTVTSAQFNIDLSEGGQGDPVTLNLAAYAGNSGALDGDSAGVAGYAGLASGTFLGSALQSTSVTSGTLSIILNGAALTAIENAEGGLFSIGGYVTGEDSSNDFLFATSLGNPLTELVVTTTSATPEPSSLLMLASGALVLLGGLRRRMK
jgi:hypothetical protein